MTAPPTLVLVHSPLVGPSSWYPVADVLRAPGRPVIVPSLVDALASSRPLYASLSAAVRDALPRRGSILVVHSGAGALVPSILETSSSLVQAVIFADATLPYPGRTWLDTVPSEMADELRSLVGDDGLLAPWHEWFGAAVISELLPEEEARAAFCADVPQLPWRYLEEVAPVLDEWRSVPCGYLQLSDGYDDAAAEARRNGWPVSRYDGHHLSAVIEPAAVADAIGALSDRLQASRS